MIAHACLLKSAFKFLNGEEKPEEREKTIKAARHARQLQDLPHAIDLYAQVIIKQCKRQRRASGFKTGQANSTSTLYIVEHFC